MNDQAKLLVDASSMTIVAGTLIEWLPAAAAGASLVWTLLRIYEMETFRKWIRKCRKQ
tara:strand:- start:8723 stop:8896 length:174 start_codon:yes stop_codon:yes gene_type:complete